MAKTSWPAGTDSRVFETGRCGDVVVIVDHHVARDGAEGYSIEVFHATGDTIAVATMPEKYLEPLRSDEVLCAPVLQPA